VIFNSAAFSLKDPQDSPWADGPAEYEGNAIGITDEARSFLVHLLRDTDSVDRKEFRAIFGADMTEILPTALAGWQREGVARLEEDVLRFIPQDRRERIRSLLWLVPQEGIEFDLAHFDELELSPAGIDRLAANLETGLSLAGGHRFAGSAGGRLLLQTPEGDTLRLRVAPALTDQGPLRLVLESAPAGGATDDLRRAVGQLRGLLTHQHRQRTRRAPHTATASSVGQAS
jgi:hypothetical protein